MKKKKFFLIGGLIALVVGFALIIYGVYGTYKMAEARRDINSKTNFVPDNPVKGYVKERLHERVDEYRMSIALLYTGGVILIIAGGVLIYYGRKPVSG